MLSVALSYPTFDTRSLASASSTKRGYYKSGPIQYSSIANVKRHNQGELEWHEYSGPDQVQGFSIQRVE